MLATIAKEGYRSYLTWQRIQNRDHTTWSTTPSEETLDLLDPDMGDKFNKLVKRLTDELIRVEGKCPDCRKDAQAQQTNHASHPTNPLCLKSSSSGPNLPSSSSSDSNPTSKNPKITKKQIKSFPELKGAHRNREFLNPRQPKHHNTAFPFVARNHSFQPLKFKTNFDEYYLGPTQEDNQTYPKQWDNFAMPTFRSCWEYFKDYGYRIDRNFALMYNSDRPWEVKNHLLPVGPTFLHPPYSESLTGNYTLSRNGQETMVSVVDVVSWGMEEMMSHVPNPGTPESFNAFVCGRTTDDDYIHLDPKYDGVDVDPKDIVTCLDIDSMIWVTHELHFLQALKVFVLPYEGKKAPIHKNNHVYVEILMPRSDQDKETRNRYEWDYKSFPVSSIPHIPFAHLGDGAGSINIYVFFPRLIHRDEFRNFRVNRVPYEVQCSWFTDVVYPAIKACSTPGVIEYTDFTIDEWRWKASLSHRFVDTKTTPVPAKQLDGLVYAMREIIRNNYDDLDIYGSFFFLCDFRGAKGVTTDEEPYEALKREFPAMDWEFAMKRENGQLHFDLGISFHPVREDRTPLVGLWKLDSVRASYEAGGMNKGTVHYCSTLSRYGGMQAEMEHERKKAVQLGFRSTYCLNFEAIRRPGSDVYFCDDSEAYDISPAFVDCCARYETIFQNSKKKAFGVREEIRGSGPAIKIALKSAKERVSTFCLLVKNQLFITFI